MSLWRQLARGLRTLGRRASADHDIDDEVRSYVEHAAAAHRRRGLAPDDAWRAAQIEVGNVTVAREQVRSYGWENAIDDLVTDLRYTFRRLRSNPGFTVVAVSTLALGIGTSTAIFSAVNPILFEPLPYPHAERVMTLTDHGGDGAPLAVTFGTYREIAARARAFSALAVASVWQPTLTGLSHPQRLDGQVVTADYFRVLGVAPTIGRDFDPADDRRGGPDVAIISDALWRTHFGADAGIVGRQVKFDDQQFTVIGVMPPGFENVVSPAAGVWSLLQYPVTLPSEGPEWGHNLTMIARRRAGVSADGARLDLQTIAEHRVAEFARPPWAAMRQPLALAGLQEDVTRGVRPALLSVLGAVALVLLIACVNIANLLLARGAQRRGEITMRLALGADSRRLLRQMLTESTVLALIGGAFGLVLAKAGIRALIALSPPELPRLGAIAVNGTALAFALAVSAAVGIVVGLAPALRASRQDVRSGIQEGARSTVGGHQRARRVLVVAEVALATVLLVSAGLLFRSLERLFAVDPGFAPSHVLTMRVQLVGQRFSSDDETFLFFARALDAVRNVPGVTAAAFTSQLPLSGDGDMYGAHFESSTTGRNEGSVFRYAVSPGYFHAIGIPLLRGRLLESTDRRSAPHALVINESFAKRKFPGQNPLGQRLRVGPDRGPWYTVVGVVGDVKQLSLATKQTDAIYITPEQSWFADQVMSLVARTRGEPLALAAAVEYAIRSVDKDQPVERVGTMDALVAASEAQRRFALVIFEAFAIVALLLAAIGLYGVLAGSVSERLRELGVRAALGASPRAIVRLVVWQGMALTLGGLAIGVVAAAGASRALTSLLFGTSRVDPATYAGVAVLLGVVAAIACGLPARRASRVDPASTLRAE